MGRIDIKNFKLSADDYKELGLELLNEENYNKYNNGTNESHKEFIECIDSLGLDIGCFYVDVNEGELYRPLYRFWYIDGFLTLGISSISISFIHSCELKKKVIDIKKIVESKFNREIDFISIFMWIEKKFKMHYLLGISNKLNDKEFVKLYEVVYTSCNYGYEKILTENMLERLKRTRDLEEIKNRLYKDYGIDGDRITIYRGEGDYSTSYEDGAVSWSLDYDIASFFANRFGSEEPRIYEATVLVKDILMLIGEEEKEILVTNDCLIDVEEEYL